MRIGIVGRFDKQKGHIYFVEAIAKVIKKFNNIEVMFIGEGILRPMIENKVKELYLSSYCHFLGNRLDIGDLLPTLDVFVLSSLWEGLPISLLEAQYFGVASVVTNVGGNPEVIKNEYNGLLVPRKNPERLSSAILRILTNDKLRHDFGRNAKKIFANNFVIDKMTGAYLDLISHIINNKYVINKN